ncbi:MAG: hypothetical protein ACRELC_10960 [Gemmatimonadota bacterium]
MTGDAYARSLEAHGLQDVQPLYRALLKRLKAHDAAAYEAAVARYKERVEPAVEGEDPEADPVEVWLAYGRWMAERLSPGAVHSVAPNGRADPLRGNPPPGSLLLHLPDDRKERAILLAMPADPSGPQKETADLLCG